MPVLSECAWEMLWQICLPVHQPGNPAHTYTPNCLLLDHLSSQIADVPQLWAWHRRTKGLQHLACSAKGCNTEQVLAIALFAPEWVSLAWESQPDQAWQEAQKFSAPCQRPASHLQQGLQNLTVGAYKHFQFYSAGVRALIDSFLAFGLAFHECMVFSGQNALCQLKIRKQRQTLMAARW